MNLPPKFAHVTPGHFRKPIIDAGEQRENRPRRHNIMEVGDDVIGVVQVQVAEIEAQRQARQTADAEHRQKAEREKHRRVDADGAAPQRQEHARQDDDRRHGDDHRGGLKERAQPRAHARQIHVMRPDDERHEPDGQHRIDQGFIAPNGLAHIIGQNLGYNANGGQNQNIDFGMRQKPEQMLPEQRTAAAADMANARRRQAGRQEETRVRDLVHQLHDAGGFERRKCEQQEEPGYELRPDKKRQPHPGHSRRAQLNDGRQKIHGSQQRRGNQKDHAHQPESLAGTGNDRGQWRIGSPARLSRAARHEKAHQHDHSADDIDLVTGHVNTRKRHVRRADLQGHDEITEGRERQRHDAQKHHDGAVHGAEGIVQIRAHDALVRHVAQGLVQQRADAQRDGGAWMRDGPAHHHHQAKAEEQEQQGGDAVLNTDDLVVRGENVFLQEAQFVVMGFVFSRVREGVRGGCLHT